MQTTIFSDDAASGAIFSPCRAYRYILWRKWNPRLPTVLFIGLNPSTADETEDDPTIRRCIDFAKSWGFGGMHIANLFGFRTPHPRLLRQATDPVGPENDKFISDSVANARLTVLIWGNNGTWLDRWKEVLPLVDAPHCLVVTKIGQPGHPLYLRKSLRPIPYAFPQ